MPPRLFDTIVILHIRPLFARTPRALLAGLLLLAVVLLGAGIWSWVSFNDPPRLGTWTDSGTVHQIVGDVLSPTSEETLFIDVGGSQYEYTLDPTEFGLLPDVEEGDQVTIWVATVDETVYSPYLGQSEKIDWRVVELQSQRGSWIANDYSLRVAAAQAAANPGFGMNYQTVRWAGPISGALIALIVLIAFRARATSAREPRRRED